MIFTWIVTIISITGVILNIYKNKYCYAIWTLTNLIWCIIDFYKGIYAQSFLFAVYFILSIIGLIKWIKDDKKNDKKEYKPSILMNK